MSFKLENVSFICAFHSWPILNVSFFFRHQATGLEEQLAAALGELEAIKIQLQQSQGQVQDLGDQLAASRRELDGGQAQHSEWQAKMAALREEVAAKDAKIAELLSSSGSPDWVQHTLDFKVRTVL